MTVAAPPTQDIVRVRGDTSPFTTTLTDENGVAIDITGFTFRLSVDPSDEPVDDSAKLFTLLGSVTDAVNGEVTWTLNAVESDQLPDVYFYDLEQTDQGGFVRTILRGSWTVIQDVTK